MSSGSPAPDAVQVFLFKDSYAPFVALLEENGIEFSHPPPRGVVLNSGATIEILSIVVPALAGIIITYLKGKQSRVVTITTKNHEVFHAKGYSVKALGRILASAQNLNVIDTGHKADEGSHGQG